jgi:hypothetical protein
VRFPTFISFYANLHQVHFEPTSIPKSLKIFHDPATVLAGSIKSISPNQHELVAMSEAARKILPSVENTLFQNQLSEYETDGNIVAMKL